MSAFEQVSVVIPAYNASRDLGRALAGISSQTLPPHEIIVVDDGSTDDTAAVARAHPGVTCISQPNRGVSAARNTAIKAATGTWIAIHDADDDWMPQKNERQIALLDRHRDVAWAACRSDFVLASGERVQVWPDRLPPHLRTEVVPYFESVMAGVPYATSGVVIRRDVFDLVGGFDEALRVAEERDLFWRIASRFPRIAYVYETSFGYHLGTPRSLTKGSNDRSQSLGMICANLRRSRSAAGADGEAMRRYGRDLVVYNYLARQASGEIELSGDIVSEAISVAEPTAGERMLLALLKVLPGVVARRVARMVAPGFH